MKSWCHTFQPMKDFHLMARLRRVEFTMEYRIAFECVIRGHHIYKDTWNPVIGEILNCRSNPRVEAIQYDSNALGLYKEVERVEHLVGHVPVEVSCLLTNFLNARTRRTRYRQR